MERQTFKSSKRYKTVNVSMEYLFIMRSCVSESPKLMRNETSKYSSAECRYM